MVQSFAKLGCFSALFLELDCATYQLGFVLCLLQVEPGITGYL